MKKENVLRVNIEYGKESLKQIILELLKEEYINYITKNEKWMPILSWQIIYFK